MKTRSKRFLNLATLCLALLGTTLLMGRPVKAEVVQSVGGDRSAEEEKIKNDYMKRLGLSDLTGQYDKDRFEGYLDGYKDGRRPGAPESPKKTERYDPESQNPSDGYGDGYGGGYTDGYNNRMLNRNREETPENNSPETSDVDNHGKSQDQNNSPETSDVDNHGNLKINKEDSTGESPVSELLSVIESLVTFVLTWFGLN
ncbi:TPA: hypothetical protein ACMHGD_000621 [Streptococcus pyogenes]